MVDGAPEGYGIFFQSGRSVYRALLKFAVSDNKDCSFRPHLVSSVSIFVINIMGIHRLLLLTSYHVFMPFWRFSDFNPWDVTMWGSAKLFYVKKESTCSKWLGAAGLDPAIQDFLAEERYIFFPPKSQVGLGTLPYLIVRGYRRLILFLWV
jgi:hypothetical protein